MKWCETPYSYLAMTKPSEYSDESRLEVRPAHAKYLFVYPFVKTREWYRLPADERWRIMQEHIKVGREYPQIDLNTSYSFGLDDQEFVVAFETDEPAAFLDLVQRLRTTEASAYTKRDTPTFTCVACSVERALERARRDAADGRAHRMTTDLERDFGEIRDITVIGAGPVGLSHRVLGRDAAGIGTDHRLAARARRAVHDAVSGEVGLRRPGHPKRAGEGPRGEPARTGAGAVRRARAPGDDREHDLVGRRRGDAAHRPRRPALAHRDRRRRPRRVRAQAAARVRRRHGALGGPRRALHRGREGGVRGQARGDRRRRRLGVGLGREPRRHRLARDAGPPPRRLPRPRGDGRRGDGARRRRPRRPARAVRDQGRSPATGRSRASSCTTRPTRPSSRWSATRSCCNSASRPSSAR